MISLVHKFSLRCLALFGLVVCVVTGVASAAQATPQMLAVAELQSPQPLMCENGQCTVELSAMCLQKNRRFPGTQSIYHPHNPDSIQLVLTDGQGVAQRLVADTHVTIRSKRTFTAVTIGISEAALRDLGHDLNSGPGLANAAIVVAAHTTLVPDPVPYDPFPLSVEEIAEVAGPMRLLASAWLSGDGQQTTAARLVNKMLNGFIGDHADGTLWQTAVGLDSEVVQTDSIRTDGTQTTGTQAGVMQARAILDTCITRQTSVSGESPGPAGTVRQCLEMGHDSVMYGMNTEYWNTANTGS